MIDLYQHEAEALKNFQEKLDNDNYSKKDVIEFKESYQNLFEESRMMIKISDRLQKKLDKSNKKINEKNEVILEKNQNLQDAIEKVTQARVGKKASTLLFSITILLFVSEEIIIEPFVEDIGDYHYTILAIKGGIALGLKFFESVMESYFLKSEKKRILDTSEEIVPA